MGLALRAEGGGGLKTLQKATVKAGRAVRQRCKCGNLETRRDFTETVAGGDITSRNGVHKLVDLRRRFPGKMESPVASFPFICTDRIQKEGNGRNKEL